MTDVEIRHAQMVATLAKPGEAVLSHLTPADAHLWHMATGVAGEAGELLDAIKKRVIYRKELDRANIIEELGDLEFYMSAIRDIVGVSREEVLQGNLDKLGKRYQGHRYSDDQAQARADKIKREGLPADMDPGDRTGAFRND